LLDLFLKETSWIDVRAPVEFEQGHLPNAVNLPILNDEERAQVGTLYKQEGNAAAVALGHQLVSGDVKEARVQSWISHLKKHPNTVVYCFRGGQRSKISQKWISEAGVECPRLEGGYKKARRFLMNQVTEFSRNQELVLLSGATGSGKTELLKRLSRSTLDLEALARHRGSAFGRYQEPQPSQANFENLLAVKMLQIMKSDHKTFVEDESRMIGKREVPEALFEKMRASSVICIQEPLEKRMENIFQDYIAGPLHDPTQEMAIHVFNGFKNSLRSISKKLGGLRTSEILEDMNFSERAYLRNRELNSNKIWIEKLLRDYYDPLYLRSIEKRNVHILFKGTNLECEKFISL